mmetsp:Transcript_42154/g.65990  ORF Transcript_42154/g.65990 Transcript_42154/m.65990 type:complete len:121 (+) Transcript_42154:1210-1572(+)
MVPPANSVAGISKQHKDGIEALIFERAERELMLWHVLEKDLSSALFDRLVEGLVEFAARFTSLEHVQQVLGRLTEHPESSPEKVKQATKRALSELKKRHGSKSESKDTRAVHAFLLELTE